MLHPRQPDVATRSPSKTSKQSHTILLGETAHLTSFELTVVPGLLAARLLGQIERKNEFALHAVLMLMASV